MSWWSLSPKHVGMDSHGAKQTQVKAKRAHANIQQGSLQYQLNTGQRPKLPGVRCVNLQVYVKSSSLERESPSTLSAGPSFCSCNPGRLHQPYLSIQRPRLPRDTPSLALLSRVLVLSPTAWRDGTSLNPAGSHPSSSCCIESLCSPSNQKASVLWGVLPPGKSCQQVIFNNAPCRLNKRGRKPPASKAFREGNAQQSCSQIPWHPQMRRGMG